MNISEDALQRQAQIVGALGQQVEAASADGRQLVRNPPRNPICCVSLDEGVPCLVVEWCGYATSAQFRFVHEMMILLLLRHGLRKVLADNTNLRLIAAEDQAWVADDWLSRAVAAGYEVGAITQSGYYFAKLSLESVVQKGAEGLTLRFFGDVAEARGWLRSQ
jgi:hypothetical protein